MCILVDKDCAVTTSCAPCNRFRRARARTFLLSAPEEKKEEEKKEEKKKEEEKKEDLLNRLYQSVPCLYEYAEATATANYTFGEVLPAGVEKLLDAHHLNAATASVVYELGLGFGRLALQVALQWPHLKAIIGAELHPVRAQACFLALRNFALMHADRCRIAFSPPAEDFQPPAHFLPSRAQSVSVRFDHTDRRISFRRQNLFDLLPETVAQADIIIAAVALTPLTRTYFCKTISKMRTGARILTYESLELLFLNADLFMPFVPIAPCETYAVSWSPTFGHGFCLYVKM